MFGSLIFFSYVCISINNKNKLYDMEINENVKYMLGLFQADAHLRDDSRNRGKLSYEISIVDKDIVHKLDKIIPYKTTISERTRKTTVCGRDYNLHSICLSVFNLEFRNMLKGCGLISGKKAKIIKPLFVDEGFSIDYIRGLYDGDGSFGITSKGFPFASFTTDSDDVKGYICDFIAKVTSKPKKNVNRNSRDDIYNICVYREDAVMLCKILYYDNCLCIKRKQDVANIVSSWVRPPTMKVAPNRKRWDDEQDSILLKNTDDDAARILGRTLKSVKIRRFRLKTRNIN